VPRNNFHSSLGNSLLGNNLRISSHHSNGRHKIMWGNRMPNSLDSTTHTPVADMGSQASSINNLGSPTSMPTPTYAIHTLARAAAVVSESSARPVCAQSCADQNSVAWGVWAGH